MRKPKYIKEKLKVPSKEVFDYIRVRKHDPLDQIRILDRQEVEMV